MRPFRFMHTADLHLDSPFRGLESLPEAVRERVRQSTFRALERLVDTALRERVDFVVVAGDVYDAADRSLRAQLRFRQAAERLAAADIPLYVVHGNHDPDDGRSARLAWPANVRFFSSDEVSHESVKAGDGTVLAHVYGMSFRTSAVTENLAARYALAAGAPYHIALLHTNVDGDAAHDNYSPSSLKELARSGFDYWALGHIHDRRILAEEPYVVYSGNLQGRSVKETGAKGCCLVEVDEQGRSSLRFVALDDVRWFREEVSIEPMETEEQLLAACRSLLERVREDAAGRAAMLRLVLTGRGPLHARLRRAVFVLEAAGAFRAEEERLAESSLDAPFVWVESIVNETAPAIDRDVLATEMSFPGELLRLSAALHTDETELDGLVAETLAPLEAHAALGRICAEADRDRLRSWLRRAEVRALDALLPEDG